MKKYSKRPDKELRKIYNDDFEGRATPRREDDRARMKAIKPLLGGEMTIKEALENRNNYGMRVSFDDRWLVRELDVWEVYEKRKGGMPKLIISTDVEEEAVKILLGGD